MSRMIHDERTPHDDRDERPTDDVLADETDELDDDDDFDDEATEIDTAADADEPPAEVVEAADDFASGPDDALGLYLRQMGAIPLLTRDKEELLAKRLEHHR